MSTKRKPKAFSFVSLDGSTWGETGVAVEILRAEAEALVWFALVWSELLELSPTSVRSSEILLLFGVFANWLATNLRFFL